MTKRARVVSIRAPPGAAPADARERAEALAHHLVGQHVAVGHTVGLPGWPSVVVDETEPAGAVVVGDDTRVELWWPPAHPAGPAQVLFVVDASLTMGRGPAGATMMDRAAWAIESVVLSAHQAIERVGILVHGSTPRMTQPFLGPGELNAHVIHRAPARGTFDILKACDAGLGLLASEPADAPRILVVVTDGRGLPDDGARAIAGARRRGVEAYVLLADPDSGAVDGAVLKAVTFSDPRPIAEAIGRAAGIEVRHQPREPPSPLSAGAPEFEIVIETIDEGSP